MKNGLGISEEHRTLLINHVNIVFHTAASVRFNDSLKYSVRMNVNGIKELLELANDMRNLCAFIHISTAYTNTDRNPIGEVIYPPHANVNDTLAICEQVDEDTLNVLTPKYIGEIPNTYAFSKQLAEYVVYETEGKLPAVIIRPSIVVPSIEEPFPGWIDNFNGPMGLICASATGVLRSAYMDPSVKGDYVPVDVSIKSIIIAAWMRGTKGLESTDDIPVYNCCSGNLIPISIAEMISTGFHILPEIPLGPSLWHPYTQINNSKFINYVLVILLQMLPATIIDLLLKAMGRKPMLVKVQRRIYNALTALIYYSTQEWSFENKNFILLPSFLKHEDLKSFNYDLRMLDLNQYYCNFMKGARKYLLRQRDEDLPKHRKLYWRIYYLHITTLFIFWSYILWCIFSSSCVQNLASKII